MEKQSIMKIWLIKSEYSHIINSEPGMCDNPVILNLQILKWESYISVICRAILAVEDKKTDADTHLAEARRQNTGNGILGDLEAESGHVCGCFFVDNLKINHLLCRCVLVSLILSTIYL